MKIKKGLFFSLLSILFGCNLLVNFSSGKNSAKEVDAAYYQGKTIFIRNDGGQYGGWLTANAKLKVNYQDNSDNWHSDVLTDVVPIANSNSYIFKYELTCEAKNMQILRFNPELSSQWNYSNRIEYLDSSKNLFVVGENISDNNGLSYASANINHLETSACKFGKIQILVNAGSEPDIGSDAYVYSDHYFKLVAIPDSGYYFDSFISNGNDIQGESKSNPTYLNGTTGDNVFSAFFYKERDISIDNVIQNATLNKETNEFVAMNVLIEEGQIIRGIYRGGTYDVVIEDHDRDFIDNNGNEAVCKFTGYYNLYLKSLDGGKTYPNIYIASQDKIDVERFINDALLMNSYDVERTGNGDGRCSTYYQYAIKAYTSMLTDYSIELFENRPEYEEARQRFDAWKQLNSSNPSLLSHNNGFFSDESTYDDSIVLLTIMFSLASSTLLGLYILKRKKHN